MAHRIRKAVVLGLLMLSGGGLPAAPVPLPPDPRTSREIEAARADLHELQRLAADRKTTLVELFRRWRDFRARHPGTPEYREAAALLARAPSPLDKLWPATLPAEDRPGWLPKEVVAVLGQNRGRSWGSFGELAISADGRLIASRSHLFEAATLRELASLPIRYPEWLANGLAFAPTGATLARGYGTGVELWDTATSPPKRVATLGGHKNPVCTLTFLDGGKALASAGPDEVIYWDLAGPAPRKRYTLKRRGPAQLKEEATSPDGHIGGVALNDIERLLLAAEAISLDGRFLVVEGSGNHCPAMLWRLSKDAPRPVPLAEARPPFVFTPDGRKLITVSADAHLSVWDLTRPGWRTGLIPLHVSSQKGAVDVSPDGTLLAAAGLTDELFLWPLSEAGRKRLKLAPRETHRMYRLPPQVSRVKFAPNGRTLVVGCGGLLRLWDVDRQQERLPPRGHRAGVHAVAFAPDGAGLATGSSDGTLRLWGLTGARPAEGELFAAERQPPALGPNAVGPLAFSPDGRFLAATQAGDPFQEYVYFWDLAAPKPVKATRAHVCEFPASVGEFLFSPDGKTVATLGADPNTNKKDNAGPDELPALRLWSWAGGEILPRQLLRPDHPFIHKGFDIEMRWGAFSPDGRQLAAVVWADVHVYRSKPDGAFQEWACIRPSSDTATGSRAVFSGDGRALLVATHHNSEKDKPVYLDLRSWDLTGKRPRGRTICRDEKGVSPLGLAMSPDGRTLALATDEGWVSVWDVQSEKRIHKWKLPGAVWGLSFAPDSRHLATANANGTAFVFRLPRPARPGQGK